MLITYGTFVGWLRVRVLLFFHVVAVSVQVQQLYLQRPEMSTYLAAVHELSIVKDAQHSAQVVNEFNVPGCG